MIKKYFLFLILAIFLLCILYFFKFKSEVSLEIQLKFYYKYMLEDLIREKEFIIFMNYFNNTIERISPFYEKIVLNNKFVENFLETINCKDFILVNQYTSINETNQFVSHKFLIYVREQEYVYSRDHVFYNNYNISIFGFIDNNFKLYIFISFAFLGFFIFFKLIVFYIINFKVKNKEKSTLLIKLYELSHISNWFILFSILITILSFISTKNFIPFNFYISHFSLSIINLLFTLSLIFYCNYNKKHFKIIFGCLFTAQASIFLFFIFLPNMIILKFSHYFFIIPPYYDNDEKIIFMFNYLKMCLSSFELEEKDKMIAILKKIDFNSLISNNTSIKQIQIFIEMFICNFKEVKFIDDRIQFIEIRNQAEIFNTLVPLELNEKYLPQTMDITMDFRPRDFLSFLIIILGLGLSSFAITLTAEYTSYLLLLKFFKQTLSVYSHSF